MPRIQLDTADVASTVIEARTSGCIRSVDLGTRRLIEFRSDIDFGPDSPLCIASVPDIDSDLGTELAAGQLAAPTGARTSCRICTPLDWQ